MIITGMGPGDELTSAVLSGMVRRTVQSNTGYILYAALAGGTILYVVMFEVLQREKEKEVTGIYQLIGIILGFSAMMVLEVHSLMRCFLYH